MNSKESKQQKARNSYITPFNTNNNIISFNIDDYTLSITQDFNPNIPCRTAVFIEKTGEQKRISGLFSSGFNSYRGDVKKKEERLFFNIKFLNDSKLEHIGLVEALIFKGLIPQKAFTTTFKGPIRASQEQRKGGFDV